MQTSTYTNEASDPVYDLAGTLEVAYDNLRSEEFDASVAAYRGGDWTGGPDLPTRVVADVLGRPVIMEVQYDSEGAEFIVSLMGGWHGWQVTGRNADEVAANLWAAVA